MNAHIKLKDNVDFSKLKQYGFEIDSVNCEHPNDHYYHLNNYYVEIGNFRITVNMANRHIDILCLAKERVLYNIFNLKPLYDLIEKN